MYDFDVNPEYLKADSADNVVKGWQTALIDIFNCGEEFDQQSIGLGIAEVLGLFKGNPRAWQWIQHHIDSNIRMGYEHFFKRTDYGHHSCELFLRSCYSVESLESFHKIVCKLRRNERISEDEWEEASELYELEIEQFRFNETKELEILLPPFIKEDEHIHELDGRYMPGEEFYSTDYIDEK